MFFAWGINKKHNAVVSMQWYQQEMSVGEGWTFKKKSPNLKKSEHQLILNWIFLTHYVQLAPLQL